MTMRQFADHVIAVANSEGNRISNLQLQKIMYFAIGDYIQENGITASLKLMYDEPFEAWPYGPVVRSQYFRFKNYGSFSIREKCQENSKYNAFNEYIKKYIHANINKLVEESHNHSTWWKNSEKILRQVTVEYELEDLKNDFANI